MPLYDDIGTAWKEAMKARDVQAVRELLRQRVDVNTPLADKAAVTASARRCDSSRLSIGSAM